MKKYLKSLELGVVEFSEDYPTKLHSCLNNYYNIEDSSIQFYFPYIEYFSQEDNLIDYDSRFNNTCSLIDIMDNVAIFDENNTKYIGVINKNNHEFSAEVVIKRMPILNFENVMLLKKHLKKQDKQLLMPSQPLVPFGKVSSFYNSTYIETMVSYITSKLTEENMCPHYPLFYGYCIFNEGDTIYNITDDMVKLDGYSWFSENETKEFYKKYGYNILYKEMDTNKDDASFESVSIQTYASVNNSPVQLKFSEYCGEDSINGRIQFTEKEWESILFQIMYTLYVGWSYFQLTHNDLHLGNVLFKPTSYEHLYYNVSGKYYKIPTYGFMVKIIDWNRATFKINGTYFKNECFDRDGDCYGQFIFPENYYYCKNTIIPNEHTDLALLASNIIDEGNMPENTKIYEVVKGWCTNKYGVCIPDKYSKFNMYKESSKCKNSNPEKLFNSPIFTQYKILKEHIPDSETIYNISCQ
jgi:hypothetical protein